MTLKELLGEWIFNFVLAAVFVAWAMGTFVLANVADMPGWRGEAALGSVAGGIAVFLTWVES